MPESGYRPKGETIGSPPKSGSGVKAPVSERGSAHYKVGKLQPIEYIFAQGYGTEFCLGNVIKYITRCLHSNNMRSDLTKAKHYIDYILKHLDEQQE